MANIRETFILSINEGMKSASLIVEQDKKAMAYASIAEAIALSGLLSEKKGVTSKESLKPENFKGDNVEEKEEAPVKTTPSNEEVVEQAEAELQEEMQEETSCEWNDELQEKLATEINIVNEMTETYGVDKMNECVVAFTENPNLNLGDINPSNIKGFVAFLQSQVE